MLQPHCSLNGPCLSQDGVAIIPETRVISSITLPIEHLTSVGPNFPSFPHQASKAKPIFDIEQVIVFEVLLYAFCVEIYNFIQRLVWHFAVDTGEGDCRDVQEDRSNLAGTHHIPF